MLRAAKRRDVITVESLLDVLPSDLLISGKVTRSYPVKSQMDEPGREDVLEFVDEPVERIRTELEDRDCFGMVIVVTAMRYPTVPR